MYNILRYIMSDIVFFLYQWCINEQILKSQMEIQHNVIVTFVSLCSYPLRFDFYFMIAYIMQQIMIQIFCQVLYHENAENKKYKYE